MNDFPLQTRQMLKMLGFTENEIKVLQSLLVSKSMTTKELSRETTLSFDAVHYSLHALERKNIVQRRSENGEDVAEICSEDDFLRWIDEQKQKNIDFFDDAKVAVQMHLTHAGESSWKPNVHYFEGIKGVIDIYEDMIETGQDIYGWTDIQKIHNTLGEYMDEFIAKRIEKNMTSYAIMPKNQLSHEYAQKVQMRNAKFSENLPIDGEVRIYGNKVAVITFHEEKPVGFVFSGGVITSVFRSIFNDAWKASGT